MVWEIIWYIDVHGNYELIDFIYIYIITLSIDNDVGDGFPNSD